MTTGEKRKEKVRFEEWRRESPTVSGQAVERVTLGRECERGRRIRRQGIR